MNKGARPEPGALQHDDECPLVALFGYAVCRFNAQG